MSDNFTDANEEVVANGSQAASGAANATPTKLFVGGITWATTDDTLREAFSQAGQVISAQVMIDRETGRSRGFGFVEMASKAEAQAAIDMWHDQDLDGRTIIVNEARPKEDRPRNGGFGHHNRY